MSPEERFVRAKAADVMTPDSVDVWLGAPNRFLADEAPLDLVRGGRPDLVSQLLDAIGEGVTA